MCSFALFMHHEISKWPSMMAKKKRVGAEWDISDRSTLRVRQQQTQPAHPTASAMQHSQAWAQSSGRTYISVLSFLLAPFGWLQGCFHLHPAMYKGKAREENVVVGGK